MNKVIGWDLLNENLKSPVSNAVIKIKKLTISRLGKSKTLFKINL